MEAVLLLFRSGLEDSEELVLRGDVLRAVGQRRFFAGAGGVQWGGSGVGHGCAAVKMKEADEVGGERWRAALSHEGRRG